MSDFNEKHPDLNPSPICGEVKSFTREILVGNKPKVVEWYERDPMTGEMVDVLEAKQRDAEIKKLQEECEKLKKELENYE